MTAPQQPDQAPASGQSIPASPFADDDGSAQSDLAAELTAFATGGGKGSAVMTALARSRLLVPIVAVADSTQTSSSGLEVDKDSHLATVLVHGPNGERAMLAFSSIEAMANWRADARPAPVSGIGAAQTAIAEGAAALLVDVAGPTPFAVTAGDLRALASALDLEMVRGLVRERVEEIPGLEKAQLEIADASADLIVTVDPSLSDRQYRELLDTLSMSLREDERLAQIFSMGVRIQVVPSGQLPIDTPGPIPET